MVISLVLGMIHFANGKRTLNPWSIRGKYGKKTEENHLKIQKIYGIICICRVLLDPKHNLLRR